MKKSQSTTLGIYLHSPISHYDESWCSISQGFEIVAEGLENPAMREVVPRIKGELRCEVFW